MTKYTMKPLDWWEPYPGEARWRADTPFGPYFVDGPEWAGKLEWITPFRETLRRHNIDSIEAGKAAAQAHWEERLKQCLEPVE